MQNDTRQNSATWRLIVGLMFGAMLCINCYAENIPGFVVPGNKIHYLVDADHALTIESARQIPLNEWSRGSKGTLSFGFSSDVYWIQFELPRSDKDRFVQVDYALLDHITMYRYQGEDLIEEVVTGDSFDFSDRFVHHRSFLFPVAQTSQLQKIYFRIETTSSVQVPVNILDRNEFFERDQTQLALQGVYYGIVLVMALYNFFLYLRQRDSVYAFYVIYVITFVIVQLGLTGFSYQFVWSNAAEWNTRSVAVFTPLVVISCIMFSINFLDLKDSYPSVCRSLYLQAFAGLIVSGLALVVPYSQVIRLAAGLAIFTSIFLLCVSYLITIRTRQKYAVYFSVAWTIFLAGSAIIAMTKFGFMPRTPLTESSAQIGSAIEVILLSFALAERFHDESARRVKAEQETSRMNNLLIEQQRAQNDLLEIQVSERTVALSSALDDVQKLNAELRDLSTTDQLTGIRNRRYFDELFDIEFKRSQRNQTAIGLLLIDIDNFKNVNDIYGHLVGDKCLREISQAIVGQVRSPPDLVCRYGGEELAIVLPETHCKGVSALAERIRHGIQALEIESEGARVTVTVSIGYAATTPTQQDNLQALIKCVDDALYQAKEGGRNRVCAGSFKTA
jgi:diguanylate cyclase (GGDEF)-like protein